jgi:hypothetical protein
MANSVKNPESTDLGVALRRHTRSRMMGRLRRLTLTLCGLLVIIGLLNFMSFMAGTFYFGGDAWNGKIEAGKYFLWGDHDGSKGYIEVSKSVFDYSRWHVYTVMVTWPLMLVAGFAAERISRRSDA